MDDLIGKVLGDFKILDLLGQGAMARVYRAQQESPPRQVALKVIRRVPGDKADSEARFQREKTVLEKLEHPNIMPIYEFAADSDYLWIASPLVMGGTLEDRLAKGPLALTDVCKILTQLASAIDLAEQKSVVHRDIKPSNVMIDLAASGERFILSDYGVAKLLDAEGLTAPGMTLGTPEYMSPEQVLGKPLNSRSDQYSLAVMAYQLLSGKLPFSGKLMAVMEAHAKSTPPPIGAGVPASVEKALLQALAKAPASRYASASDFARAVEAAAGQNEEVEELPPGGTMYIQALKVDEVEELPPGGTMHIQALKVDEVEELPPGGTMHIQALKIDEPEAPAPAGKRGLGMLAAVGVPVLLLAGYALSRLLGSPAAAAPLFYSTRAGGDSQVWLRRPDGSTRSLGAGSHPRPWPGGKSTLVTAAANLFLVDLATGERRNLTHSSLPVESGSVSSDAKWLVFSATKKNAQVLFRMELPSGKPAPLGPGQWPCFSPDGQNLAYSSDAEGPMGIWVLDWKTRKKRRLTSPEEKMADIAPAWSPDGKRIVFERQQPGSRRLRIVNLEGKEEALEVAGAGQPTWSPCAQIGYVSDQGFFQLAPGGKPQVVVKTPREILEPAWTSP